MIAFFVTRKWGLLNWLVNCHCVRPNWLDAEWAGGSCWRRSPSFSLKPLPIKLKSFPIPSNFIQLGFTRTSLLSFVSFNIVLYSQIRRLKWILLIYSRRLVTFSGMFIFHLVVFHSNYVIARHGKTVFSNQLNETVMKRFALRPLTRNVVVDESLYFDWIKSATCLLRSLAGKRLALNEMLLMNGLTSLLIDLVMNGIHLMS